MLELVGNFPVKSFFVLFFNWKIIFAKLETILLQKVFAPSVPRYILGWYDLNRLIEFCETKWMLFLLVNWPKYLNCS